MRAVIQRVSSANVSVEGKKVAEISKGFLILLGVEPKDNSEDIEWLSNKVSNLRVFADAQQQMNLNINQVNGSFLVVSQFTLHASTKKGNRPSFIKAAEPKLAEALYLQFCKRLKEVSCCPVSTGVFGANMQVSLVNDGPVTIIIDTKNKE
jgi:D-tyrosyl-tRNA(Tyr) deacylase